MSDSIKPPFDEETTVQQLNLNDKRVRAWYAAVEKHSERCKGVGCYGCERLLEKNRVLRATPGLVVSAE